MPDPDPSILDVGKFLLPTGLEGDPGRSCNFCELECRPVPVRASLMVCYDECPRRFMWRYRYGLRPNYTALSKAITLGNFFHLFMQHGPSHIEKVLQGRDAAISILNGLIDKEGDLTGGIHADITTLQECFDKARLMAEILWSKYPDPPGTVVLGREIEYETNETSCLHQQNIPMAGRLDLIVQYSDDSIWIPDYKTTDFDPQAVVAGYSYSYACRIYRILAVHWLIEKGIDPNLLKGFQLNIVRKPSIKFCPKTKDSNKGGLFASSWLAYVDRCYHWYTSSKLEPYTQHTLRFGDSTVWPFDFLMRVLEQEKISIIPNPLDGERIMERFYPRRSRSCTDPYGRSCSLDILCNSSPEMWPSHLSGFHQEFPESPEKKEESDVEV